MPILSSKNNERRLLALLMKSPTHMKAINIPLDTFAHSSRRQAAELIKKYVRKYKSPPSMSTLKTYAENMYSNDVEETESLIKVFEELSQLPKVRIADANFEFQRADNLRIGRALADLADTIKTKFEQGESEFVEMRQEIMAELLKSASSGEAISRGMLHEKINDRIEDFKKVEMGDMGDIVPFGIDSFDSRLGGMKKSFLTLIYSKTSGGKTTTAVNIAYNAALAGYRVMYITLEMAFNSLAIRFDSRMSKLDSNKIMFGKLSKEEKKIYAETLRKQLKDKLNIWIVDVSMGAKSSLILEEIELYKAAYGVPPDLVIIDYANIMEPVARYSGRSEKYDCLFQEYHEIAKYEHVALLTATQESRDASKEDIEARRKKIDVEHGVHKIGLSNFMAVHCDIVIRLKQDSKDKTHNRLWGILDKVRYGRQGDEIPLLALWDRTYVGDNLIKNNLIVNKEKRSPAYNEGKDS